MTFPHCAIVIIGCSQQQEFDDEANDDDDEANDNDVEVEEDENDSDNDDSPNVMLSSSAGAAAARMPTTPANDAGYHADRKPVYSETSYDKGRKEVYNCDDDDDDARADLSPDVAAAKPTVTSFQLGDAGEEPAPESAPRGLGAGVFESRRLPFPDPRYVCDWAYLLKLLAPAVRCVYYVSINAFARLLRFQLQTLCLYV